MSSESIQLQIDEQNELSFDLTIEGTEMGKPQVRTIIEGGKFDLSFPTQKDEDGWTVVIPPLKEVLSVGSHNMRLEVVLNNKLFVPLTLSATFAPSQVVEARVITKKKDPVPAVKAAVVKKAAPVETETLSEQIDSAVAAAAEVAEPVEEVHAVAPVTRIRTVPQRAGRAERISQNESRKAAGGISEDDIERLISSVA